MTDHRHASHTAIVKRLSRAGGHLRSIVEMIEAGRPCVDIAQQLHAVEKAVANAKKALINDHIDRSEEHTSELQSLMRISYAVFCLKKKNKKNNRNKNTYKILITKAKDHTNKIHILNKHKK